MQEHKSNNQRCQRHRKRSQRRKIHCPMHGCFLDSVSQKYAVGVDAASRVQGREVDHRMAGKMLVAEWLEAFWCEHCQRTAWYHVREVGDRVYEVSATSPERWRQSREVVD